MKRKIFNIKLWSGGHVTWLVTTETAVAVVAATETAKGKGRKKENKQQHHQQQRSSRLKQDYLNLEYKDSGKYLYLLLLY